MRTGVVLLALALPGCLFPQGCVSDATELYWRQEGVAELMWDHPPPGFSNVSTPFQADCWDDRDVPPFADLGYGPLCLEELRRSLDGVSSVELGGNGMPGDFGYLVHRGAVWAYLPRGTKDEVAGQGLREVVAIQFYTKGLDVARLVSDFVA